MPDSVRDSSRNLPGAPFAYLPDSGSATPGLAARLQEQIRGNGPLAFPHFMAAALYDPGEGYYARPAGQVGRGGDFFTSVSTGINRTDFYTINHQVTLIQISGEVGDSGALQVALVIRNIQT